MKRLQKIIKEISDLTLKIEQDHPELYQYLDENPVTIPNIEHPNMDTRTMSDWLESLKELLKQNIENQI